MSGARETAVGTSAESPPAVFPSARVVPERHHHQVIVGGGKLIVVARGQNLMNSTMEEGSGGTRMENSVLVRLD